MSTIYPWVRGCLAVGSLLAVVGCGGSGSSSDAPVSSPEPVSGTLSLDNAEAISRRAAQAALETLALNRFAITYQGLLPGSSIQLGICEQGKVNLENEVESPVTDLQGNSLMGSRYRFENCKKPDGSLYQGDLGVYWNQASTAYVVEVDDFSIAVSDEAEPHAYSGIYVLSRVGDSGYESEFVNSERGPGAEQPVFELDAALSYEDPGLRTLQWQGYLSASDQGRFELSQEQGGELRSIISDGNSRLYIDFIGLEGRFLKAEIDLGADGALDATWSIDLYELDLQGALLLLREDVKG
ncbi:hypothetical protein [Marinobacter nauticus]|uniref:hypothetical protein n=1 Tax=Marinobacter nauticus TaxID=2743 RepID=UPI0025D4C66A|nr:hypothetical protein [uncultured Marinobacter sp.]